MALCAHVRSVSLDRGRISEFQPCSHISHPVRSAANRCLIYTHPSLVRNLEIQSRRLLRKPNTLGRQDEVVGYRRRRGTNRGDRSAVVSPGSAPSTSQARRKTQSNLCLEDLGRGLFPPQLPWWPGAFPTKPFIQLDLTDPNHQTSSHKPNLLHMD